jgi:tetratricopeptide (TPR) repeat protein
VRDLEQAVGRDSTFSRAWAALAQAYILVLPYAGTGSSTQTWLKAQAAATRALALDPTSAEAYAALGYGNMVYGWNWAAAEENLQRAIAVDPNSATAHHWYGDFLAGRGRLVKSLAEMERAHQVDPLSRQIVVEWGWVFYLMGRNDEAEARIRQALELDANYAQAYLRLAVLQIQQHRYPEAIASSKRAIDLGIFYPYAAAIRATAYAASGNRAAALAEVNDLKRRSATEWVPPVFMAAAYGGLGDLTQGFAWLNRGIDEHDIYLPEIFFDPWLDPLRKDPRFASVMVRMGFTAPVHDSSGAHP